ncbi:MAG: hypothetical protein J0L70_30500 [Leptolyngbya sp. UWPOB_LEPTO1]|uniref:hypothetical protein n=1 Tax=Leptolyngbya sp. UWPOB_LEPTO1 TaxID=2815653 RepID=UPI001AC9B2A7|nr:hypothetical protein [Leptolyngbya sp. UWPOB_LEPTO1]MBN8564867.1 hypothetical protein [Leptolyngbya sp. UWPOB_LEPTO1]
MQILKHKQRFDSSAILPLFALSTLGLQILLLLISLGSAISVWSIARKPVPAMVQLLDGHSVAMEPVDPHQRTPSIIRQFTKDSLGLMFTWSSKIQGSNVKPNAPGTVRDPGISIGTGRITTSSWQASFALREDFRNAFLEQVAKLTPSDVFNGDAQSVLSFESISEPRLIKPGEWQIDLVANLLIFDSTHPQGNAVPFNKSVFVTAIEPTTDPLPEHSSPIQKAVYHVQTSGLQIREIRDLDIEQLNR